MAYYDPSDGARRRRRALNVPTTTGQKGDRCHKNRLTEGRMRSLHVEGIVTMMSSQRRVKRGLRIADAMLTDGTGTIKLVLWEDQINKVRQGSKLRVLNRYTSSFRGTLQLNPGKYGRIEVIN
ncbi:MAG: hypothetical protein ABSF09_06660 [Candidatus Bathyarchaeia archaeon]